MPNVYTISLSDQDAEVIKSMMESQKIVVRSKAFSFLIKELQSTKNILGQYKANENYYKEIVSMYENKPNTEIELVKWKEDLDYIKTQIAKI